MVTDNYQVEIVLADQYPGINSKEYKQFLKNNNTKLVFTAVDAPFSNGLNARVNQTLVNKIRCKINETKNKIAWSTVAQKCVAAYNKTEHTITRFTPKYLVEGENTNILPDEIRPT
uniref:Uncharacterized protein LOC114349172 n=1 Tax=Diabrotica virgifera virgifera TaxID=50390 RepID=A0A6P7H050_DIAVI